METKLHFRSQWTKWSEPARRVRAALGRQTPPRFCRTASISPSYGRLSARVGANLRFGVAEALATESLLGASAGAWATSSRRAGSPSSGDVIHGLGHSLGLTSTPATRRMITWGIHSTEALSLRFGASCSRVCGAATTSSRRSTGPTTQCRRTTNATAPPTSSFDRILSLRG